MQDIFLAWSTVIDPGFIELAFVAIIAHSIFAGLFDTFI